jgi:lysozyme
MTPSARAVALIQGFEQCRLKAFKPTPNDVWTCGWGATEGVTEDTVWTQAEADDRFASDLAKFAEGVSAKLTAPTNQNQFDAMTSLAYNIGLGNFGSSTLLRLHNEEDYEGAAAQFPAWCKQAGNVLAGIVKRRAAEQAMYEEAA